MINNPEEETGQSNLSRRDFLRKLWAALGLVAVIEFITVGVAFLRPRKPGIKEGVFGGIITAGPIDTFEVDSVTAYREGQFYLVRLQDGGFLAISRKCTHLGCTVPWIEKEKKFKCPCHASSFDIAGNVTSPPAPRALDLYRVKIENNIVKVDTSKPIKRQTFNKEQVVYL